MTKLHVVSVGVSCYADPQIPDLRFAAEDAIDFDAAIRRSLPDGDVNARLFIDDGADRSTILGFLGTSLPQRVSSEDSVIFYFAGHGSPEIGSGRPTASRFLVCSDSRRDSLFVSAIDILADLGRVVERLRAKLVILILDACFSGYSGGRGFAGMGWEAFRREHRATPRLRDLDLGSGTIFVAASRDTEVAWEDVRLGHGVFSYYLQEVLREASPSETRAVIGVGTTYDNVAERVAGFTGGRQHPVLWGNVVGASLPRLRPGLEQRG